MKTRVRIWLIATLILLGLDTGRSQAGEIVVAVSTNFLLPARQISAAFEEETGNQVTLVGGATGKLATQILAGAPFDVFLAADQARVTVLADRGAAVADSRFTYAVGSLILWSRGELPLSGTGIETLDVKLIGRLSMANPKLAPYGTAAEQVLVSLGLLEQLKGRVVYAENIGQAFAMAASGNVTSGFVARSQIFEMQDKNMGNWIEVPGYLHEPIRQDAILTMRAASNEIAKAFLQFMKSTRSRKIMEGFGYGGGTQ